jgi:hypothetical protein
MPGHFGTGEIASSVPPFQRTRPAPLSANNSGSEFSSFPPPRPPRLVQINELFPNDALEIEFANCLEQRLAAAKEQLGLLHSVSLSDPVQNRAPMSEGCWFFSKAIGYQVCML